MTPTHNFRFHGRGLETHHVHGTYSIALLVADWSETWQLYHHFLICLYHCSNPSNTCCSKERLLYDQHVPLVSHLMVWCYGSHFLRSFCLVACQWSNQGCNWCLSCCACRSMAAPCCGRLMWPSQIACLGEISALTAGGFLGLDLLFLLSLVLLGSLRSLFGFDYLNELHQSHKQICCHSCLEIATSLFDFGSNGCHQSRLFFNSFQSFLGNCIKISCVMKICRLLWPQMSRLHSWGLN